MHRFISKLYFNYFQFLNKMDNANKTEPYPYFQLEEATES